MLIKEKEKSYKSGDLVRFTQNGILHVAKIHTVNPDDLKTEKKKPERLIVLDVIFANGQTARILPTDDMRVTTVEELEIAVQDARTLLNVQEKT